ncbi:hypothetical protein [Falsiroseomonas sp. HW251]
MYLLITLLRAIDRFVELSEIRRQLQPFHSGLLFRPSLRIRRASVS